MQPSETLDDSGALRRPGARLLRGAANRGRSWLDRTRYSGVHVFVIFILSLATFSRALEAELGLPRAVNWLHFPLVGGLFLVSLRHVDREARPFVGANIALLAIFIISAWINHAGAINAVAGYALLVEPFLLLSVLVNTKASRESVGVLGWAIMLLLLVQIPVALYQWYFLARWELGRAQYDLDRVQGTFTGMGAGHHVMGALALLGALWLVHSFALRPRWLKWPLATLLASLTVLSDSKQPILAVFLAFIVLRVRKVRSVAHAATLAGQIVLFLAGIYAVLRRFGTHGYFHKIPTVVHGFIHKFTVVSILVANFHSPINWIFGIGPGHGVSRMGGWLIDRYWDVLEPLGATRTDVAQQAWRASEPYAKMSSFFVGLTSWAGIFGDVGLAGLFVYATLLWLTYRRLCIDDLSRLFVLAIVFLGFFFEWLEAYNFMLCVVAIIAQRWLAQGGGVAPPTTSGSVQARYDHAADEYEHDTSP